MEPNKRAVIERREAAMAAVVLALIVLLVVLVFGVMPGTLVF